MLFGRQFERIGSLPRRDNLPGVLPIGAGIVAIGSRQAHGKDARIIKRVDGRNASRGAGDKLVAPLRHAGGGKCKAALVGIGEASFAQRKQPRRQRVDKKTRITALHGVDDGGIGLFIADVLPPQRQTNRNGVQGRGDRLTQVGCFTERRVKKVVHAENR